MGRRPNIAKPFDIKIFRDQIKGRPPFELAQVERDVREACETERRNQARLEAEIRGGTSAASIAIRDEDLEPADGSAVQ